MAPTRLSPTLVSWASELDARAQEQAEQTARLSIISGHVALMPDAHWGLGATVGSVIPTDGALIPAAVGVDIGCGMIAVETSLRASDLPESLDRLHSRIARAVPAGVGKGHAHRDRDVQALIGANDGVVEAGLAERADRQMGTLGSGNHFIEVCLDSDDVVWVVLHSGSRGVGNRLAMGHIDRAKGLMAEYLGQLPNRDLAYLVEGTPEFDAYVRDLEWAQRYARQNREVMMDAVLAEMVAIAPPMREVRRINCHHNYAARETHDGREIWVTRKGAIRARPGDLGVVPGSMGTNTFIVRGLGGPMSYDSAAHGAGRRMSRTRARKEFSADDLARAMGDRTWNAKKAKALVDEIPGAYKDVTTVMRDQADLVEVERELCQILNYKGT